MNKLLVQSYILLLILSSEVHDFKVIPMLRDHSPACPVCPVCNGGVLWPNGWMNQDATRYRGRPRHRRHCVRWIPSSPTERGKAAFPIFQASMSIVAKPISATAELLYLYLFFLTYLLPYPLRTDPLRLQAGCCKWRVLGFSF